MSSIRPEVRSFVQATQWLVSPSVDGSSLTDEEIAKIADCLSKIEKVLQDSDGDGAVNGDGQP